MKRKCETCKHRTERLEPDGVKLSFCNHPNNVEPILIDSWWSGNLNEKSHLIACRICKPMNQLWEPYE